MQMPTHYSVSDTPGSSRFICPADRDIDPSNVLKFAPYVYCLIVIVVGPDDEPGSRGWTIVSD